MLFVHYSILWQSHRCHQILVYIRFLMFIWFGSFVRWPFTHFVTWDVRPNISCVVYDDGRNSETKQRDTIHFGSTIISFILVRSFFYLFQENPDYRYDILNERPNETCSHISANYSTRKYSFIWLGGFYACHTRALTSLINGPIEWLSTQTTNKRHMGGERHVHVNNRQQAAQHTLQSTKFIAIADI